MNNSSIFSAQGSASKVSGQRVWIRLPSGARFDLVNPTASTWQDSDIAIRLSRTYRWSGESSWSLPLSVAQHSFTVLAIRTSLAGRQLTAQEQLMELLHDADEAFLGVDVVSSLKPILGQPFRDLTDRLSHAIRKRYQLPAWSEAAYREHKLADHIAAASEAFHVVGWSEHEIRDVLRIDAPILEKDPIGTQLGVPGWQPWSAELAQKAFTEALSMLLKGQPMHL
jgi:hypothetical protein